ncbi:HNH endonuclease [Anaeromyxobacter diazotrophicus]|uniref:HNH nuclease domain-containing protein n=1 Tax=Anaeromyxobacter diazotrophicus TaxID=2590199 RepID=A0A7I9VKC1_9BACT|nr:HNH endonuclease signature motif containing protein [Anaeromyxobacter diazotrophicus]GEJ56600.1 hypothetical protein AMYX_13410 [Anaeromyxobacter diazotrophicus]
MNVLPPEFMEWELAHPAPPSATPEYEAWLNERWKELSRIREKTIPRATWRKVRREYLASVGLTCEGRLPQNRKCRALAKQVHHVIPLSHGGAPFDPNNLLALCARCHARAHRPTRFEWRSRDGRPVPPRWVAAWERKMQNATPKERALAWIAVPDRLLPNRGWR